MVSAPPPPVPERIKYMRTIISALYNHDRTYKILLHCHTYILSAAPSSSSYMLLANTYVLSTIIVAGYVWYRV